MDHLHAEEITPNDEMGRIIHEHILNEFCEGYVLVGEDRICIPKYFLNIAEQIKDFEVKNDDVYVITYPKSGTTWVQEMVWMISNNLDFEGAKKVQNFRFPMLEMSALFDDIKKFKVLQFDVDNLYVNSVELVANQQSPRFIKCHLPFSLLPDQIRNRSKTPKLIYVLRNPKDVCVSLCHFGCLCEGWNIDLEKFAKLFMADRAMYSSYWKHVFGYWNIRDWPNIFIIKYEDMKADLPSVIRKVAKFLEKELTEEQVESLANHLSFESMKNNAAVNKEYYIDKLREHNLIRKESKFIRTGSVGKYKEELSPDTIKNLNAWIKENVVGTSFEQEYNFNL